MIDKTNKWDFVKFIILGMSVLSLGMLLVPFPASFFYRLVSAYLPGLITAWIIVAHYIILIIFSILDLFHYGKYFIHKSYTFINLAALTLVFTGNLGGLTIPAIILMFSSYILELFTYKYKRCLAHQVIIPSIAIIFVNLVIALVAFVPTLFVHFLILIVTATSVVLIDFIIPVGAIWFLYYKKSISLRLAIIFASILTAIVIIGIVLLFFKTDLIISIWLFGLLGILFSPIYVIKRDYEVRS